MLDLSAEAVPCRNCEGKGQALCRECLGLGTHWINNSSAVGGAGLRHCGTCKDFSGRVPCDECERTGLVRGREFDASSF